MNLKIVAVDHKRTEEFSQRGNRVEVQAQYERMWHTEPEHFDPTRNVRERERLVRTLALIEKHLDLNGKLIADLGCGSGTICRTLRDAGATVHAVDIASNALKRLQKEQRIETFQGLLPRTTLDDDTYDLVVSTDVIAYLPEKEHRLYFSELSRLIHREGFVICSTPLDFHSEDAIAKFLGLAQTEFEIIDWAFSFHKAHIRLTDFFEAPSRFLKASKNPDYRKRALEERQGFSKTWFKWNSHPLWGLVRPFILPFNQILQNRQVMLQLEKLTPESGLTHAIFLGKRRRIWE